MQPAILSPDESDEYYIQEGCYILDMLNKPLDPALSVARARVLPGQVTRWHRLQATVERYVILQGQGSVEIADLPPKAVVAGDTVLIPAGCRQRIANTGGGDLLFLAICTPRFVPEAYEDLESSG